MLPNIALDDAQKRTLKQVPGDGCLKGLGASCRQQRAQFDVMLARGGLAEELFECHGCLADQHGETVDSTQPPGFRFVQQRCFYWTGHDVIDD